MCLALGVCVVMCVRPECVCACLCSQVSALRGELQLKDRQLASLREQLSDARAATAGGGGGGDGGFEDALREEMEAMRVAFERKIKSLEDQMELAGLRPGTRGRA